jgi:hypothetical protein
MSIGSIILDIGQYYTKAGLKIENIPLRVIKTHHHLVFDHNVSIDQYEGFKCGKERILKNLNDRDAYNVVHEFIDYIFFE